jgi:predicted CXXCH cytochrome family protein
MNRLLTTLKIVALSALLMGMTVLAAGAADPGPKPVLTNSDCVKCHSAAPAAIAANGGAHKTEIGCQDCHAGHPPTVKKIIPACGQCHSDKPHYKLSGCLRCHNNPHTPKIIKLANNLTDECVTCHAPQIVKLKQVKSKHSALACSFCHNTHGKVPLCTQCHKPHSSEMTAADCKRCHQAHMPTVVTYSSDTANKLCAACHKKAFELHSQTDTKHKGVNCVTCHKDKHKMIPTCQGCHGTPHPARMLARFSRCGECHNIAHDLNRWETGTLKQTGSDKVDASKLPKKAPKKK